MNTPIEPYYLDNPAGRVHRFFGELMQYAPGEIARDKIAAALEYEWPRQWPEVLSAGAYLGREHARAHGLLGELPDAVARVALDRFGDAGEALAKFPLVGGDNNLAWFYGGFNETGLQSLAMGSALLHSASPDPVLPAEKVAELLAQLETLLESVATAEGLDPETRGWVISRLAEVQERLRGIAVTGYEGVERAINEMVGGLRRRPGLLERLRQSPVVRDVVMFIVAVDLALNMAANIRSIEGSTQAPPQPSPVVVEIVQVTEVNIGEITRASTPALPPAPPPEARGD